MATLKLGHPSKRKLERWAQGEDVSLDRHLQTCEHCADRLEQMLGESNDSIRSALLQLLLVPPELSDRLEAGIQDNADARQDLLLVTELFGIPMEIARVFTATDQGDD